MKKKNDLHNLTVELINYTDQAEKIFANSKQTGEKGDFYQEVEPFVNQVRDTCQQWEPLAIEWVQEHYPKNIHTLQVKNTVENIQMVSVRAYFPDTSLKRYTSHIQSVRYILQRILEEIEK